MSINRNGYIPRFIPPKERDFLNYLDQLKFEVTLRDPDNYFENVRIINFDIIHHLSRADALEKQYSEHFSVKNKDFTNYSKTEKKKVTGGLLRKQKETKQHVFIDRKVRSERFKN